jgi:ZIP family zinc transporter
LNIAAGLSTCIGGIIIFNKKLVYLTNPSSLGIAFGVSAGVMIFIALGDIFGESVNAFQEGFGGKGEQTCDRMCKGNSKMFTAICFISGAAIIFLIDFIIHKISPEIDHDLSIDKINTFSRIDSKYGSNLVEVQTSHGKKNGFGDMITKRTLNRMGILTALAIAIHNLPEGVTTYTGAVKDTRLGIALAIAIALHNIPEGIAVATPIYFATGSKFRALRWTFISALAEPFGGIIGWLITSDGLNANVNGIMFGLVAGMMVTISIKELIPTAHRFCLSRDKVTYSILFGMCVIEFSLILLDYAGV